MSATDRYTDGMEYITIGPQGPEIDGTTVLEARLFSDEQDSPHPEAAFVVTFPDKTGEYPDGTVGPLFLCVWMAPATSEYDLFRPVGEDYENMGLEEESGDPDGPEMDLHHVFADPQNALEQTLRLMGNYPNLRLTALDSVFESFGKTIKREYGSERIQLE